MTERNEPASSRRSSGRFRRGARRQRVRRSLTTAVATGLIGTALIFGGNWVLHAPYFRIQHVQVTGNAHESTSAIAATLGLAAKPALFNYSTSTAQTLLGQFPWVARAIVRKHWPNTLDIVITETHVVGVTKWGSRWVYVSADGTNLGVAPASANVPTIIYSESQAIWPFTRAAAGAVTVAAQLPPAFAGQVRQVVESTSGSVSLRLTTPVTFELGLATQLGPKFVAIASVIKNATLVPGDVVNVEVPTELSVSGPKAGSRAFLP